MEKKENYAARISNLVEENQILQAEYLQAIPPGLKPVSELLNLLVDAKVSFSDGRPLSFEVHVDNYWELIAVPLVGEFLIVKYMEDLDRYYFGVVKSIKFSHTELKETDKLESVMDNMVTILGNNLTHMGLLDRSIYPKKVQDSLGL
jgi:hypothetical protein